MVVGEREKEFVCVKGMVAGMQKDMYRNSSVWCMGLVGGVGRYSIKVIVECGAVRTDCKC